MKLSDFDYNLPPELIATHPTARRDQARLLVLHKNNGAIEHKIFADVIDYLQPGDLLVANNSKVIPARLIGKKETPSTSSGRGGGEVEVFLSKNISPSTSLRTNSAVGTVWECLIKGKVKAGSKIVLSEKLSGEVLGGDETKEVKFNLSGGELMNELEKIGEVPLPPYIVKSRKSLVVSQYNNDKEDYQTVYADETKKGSVAAPTAGLHFTPELLEKIKDKGVNVEYLTLHVGLGTFLPVKTEKIEEHKIHSEYAEVSAELIEKIVATKKAGHKVFAVGTTSARTLEYVFGLMTNDFRLSGFAGFVDIFIYPPYEFKVVDGLITNFHLPKSTLLMLVSALAGKKNIDKAYKQAIEQKYRFYSYGDAMLII